MDRLDAYRLLMRVVERRSFTAAAADLGVSRSSATEAVGHLEARLGTLLLHRTTRQVTPTLDGEAFYRRCADILARVEDAEAAFAPAQPHGLLRIDVPPPLARAVLLPRLPEFLKRHPRLDLQLGEGDRLVDLIGEGVDCVIRAGEPDEGGMVVRRIATLHEVTCASPAYLGRHGTPRSLTGLAGHQMVGFVSSRTGQVMPLAFRAGGATRRITLPSRVTVTGTDAMAAFGRLGYGIVQQPRYRLREDLASGRLVEILPDHPPPPLPLSVLYPQGRQPSPRVRAFIDWVSEVFATTDF